MDEVTRIGHSDPKIRMRDGAESWPVEKSPSWDRKKTGTGERKTGISGPFNGPPEGYGRSASDVARLRIVGGP
jgi:hypothetical protein